MPDLRQTSPILVSNLTASGERHILRRCNDEDLLAGYTKCRKHFLQGVIMMSGYLLFNKFSPGLYIDEFCVRILFLLSESWHERFRARRLMEELLFEKEVCYCKWIGRERKRFVGLAKNFSQKFSSTWIVDKFSYVSKTERNGKLRDRSGRVKKRGRFRRVNTLPDPSLPQFFTAPIL